ncbi:Uncharacterized protein DAT39_007039, partial [Clarias magur]
MVTLNSVSTTRYLRLYSFRTLTPTLQLVSLLLTGTLLQLGIFNLDSDSTV